MFCGDALPAVESLDISLRLVAAKAGSSLLVTPIPMLVGKVPKVFLFSGQPFLGFKNSYDQSMCYSEHMLGSSSPTL